VITRRLVCLTPVLLIAGIVAQVIALIFVLLLWVPCLIWPGLLNPAYNWITTNGARMMARSMLGRTRANSRRATETETASR
jgi:hypothetical protein